MGVLAGIHHWDRRTKSNEYLAVENQILRGRLKRRLRLSDSERATLGDDH